MFLSCSIFHVFSYSFLKKHKFSPLVVCANRFILAQLIFLVIVVVVVVIVIVVVVRVLLSIFSFLFFWLVYRRKSALIPRLVLI